MGRDSCRVYEGRGREREGGGGEVEIALIISLQKMNISVVLIYCRCGRWSTIICCIGFSPPREGHLGGGGVALCMFLVFGGGKTENFRCVRDGWHLNKGCCLVDRFGGWSVF